MIKVHRYPPEPGLDDIVDQLHAGLDEAMCISAPLQWDWAVENCSPSRKYHYDCTHYHRLWQYLLLWGLTTSMRPDSGFIIDKLRGMATGNERNHILISGSADYALLAHVLQAYKSVNAEADLTVVDRCASPLNSNLWYAGREGCRINTIQEDILEYQSSGRFDGICTHSFLIWFPLEEQYRLICKWHDLLKPGGRILTSLRLRAGEPGSIHRYTETEARQLQERVRLAALEHIDEHKRHPEEFGAAAYEYAMQRKRYTVNDRAVYRDMFEKAGFVLESMDLRVEPDRGADRPSGPAGGDLGRLHIAARRK